MRRVENLSHVKTNMPIQNIAYVTGSQKYENDFIEMNENIMCEPQPTNKKDSRKQKMRVIQPILDYNLSKGAQQDYG